MKAIDSVEPIKNLKEKTNSISWFDTEVISVIQKRDKLPTRYKMPGLETEKNNFKTAKIFLQKMLYRKKLLFRGKTSFKLKKTYTIKENSEVLKKLLKKLLSKVLRKEIRQTFRYPVDTGRKLNVHKTSRRRRTSSERLMYVQLTSCVYGVNKDFPIQFKPRENANIFKKVLFRTNYQPSEKVTDCT